MEKDDIKPIPAEPVIEASIVPNPITLLILFLVIWITIDIWLKLFYEGLKKVTGGGPIDTKTLVVVGIIMIIITVFIAIKSGMNWNEFDREVEPLSPVSSLQVCKNILKPYDV